MTVGFGASRDDVNESGEPFGGRGRQLGAGKEPLGSAEARMYRYPAPVAAGPTVSGLDAILAIAAAVIGLAAVASTAYMIWGLPNLQ